VHIVIVFTSRLLVCVLVPGACRPHQRSAHSPGAAARCRNRARAECCAQPAPCWWCDSSFGRRPL